MRISRLITKIRQ